MIHTSQGSQLHWPSGPAIAAQWYRNLSDALAAVNPPSHFDMVGLSFYPNWGAGNTSNIGRASAILDALPSNVGLFVAETAYPYSCDQLGAVSALATSGQFPCSPAGQLAYARSIIADTKALGPRARGVSWWGTEWVNGSGAGLTALWDREWTALPALLEGFKSEGER